MDPDPQHWFHLNKMCSLACLKAKTKEKLGEFFYYIIDKNPFCPFLENKSKYLTTFKFKLYFWRLFFGALGRFLQIFKKY